MNGVGKKAGGGGEKEDVGLLTKIIVLPVTYLSLIWTLYYYYYWYGEITVQTQQG